MPYKDPEQHRAACLRHYYRNQEQIQQRNRAWKQENHEHYLLDHRRYNATCREQNKERLRGFHAESKGTGRRTRKA